MVYFLFIYYYHFLILTSYSNSIAFSHYEKWNDMARMRRFSASPIDNCNDFYNLKKNSLHYNYEEMNRNDN